MAISENIATIFNSARAYNHAEMKELLSGVHLNANELAAVTHILELSSEAPQRDHFAFAPLGKGAFAICYFRLSELARGEEVADVDTFFAGDVGNDRMHNALCENIEKTVVFSALYSRLSNGKYAVIEAHFDECNSTPDEKEKFMAAAWAGPREKPGRAEYDAFKLDGTFFDLSKAGIRDLTNQHPLPTDREIPTIAVKCAIPTMQLFSRNGVYSIFHKLGVSSIDGQSAAARVEMDRDPSYDGFGFVVLEDLMMVALVRIKDIYRNREMTQSQKDTFFMDFSPEQVFLDSWPNVALFEYKGDYTPYNCTLHLESVQLLGDSHHGAAYNAMRNKNEGKGMVFGGTMMFGRAYAPQFAGNVGQQATFGGGMVGRSAFCGGGMVQQPMFASQVPMANVTITQTSRDVVPLRAILENTLRTINIVNGPNSALTDEDTAPITEFMDRYRMASIQTMFTLKIQWIDRTLMVSIDKYEGAGSSIGAVINHNFNRYNY